MKAILFALCLSSFALAADSATEPPKEKTEATAPKAKKKAPTKIPKDKSWKKAKKPSPAVEVPPAPLPKN